MIKLRILYILLACVAVIAACKKNDTKIEVPVIPAPIPTNKTTKELISVSSWKITALTSTVLGDVWNNGAIIKACNKDNSYFFRTNDTLTTYDTPSKCNTTDPDSTSGPYKIVSNNKRIYLELKLGTIQIKDTTDIQTLDDNTMILNIEYSGFPGVITFKH